ncbi:MAG: hypothetical protein U0325_00840 [Polyangiales bacterium]
MRRARRLLLCWTLTACGSSTPSPPDAGATDGAALPDLPVAADLVSMDTPTARDSGVDVPLDAGAGATDAASPPDAPAPPSDAPAARDAATDAPLPTDADGGAGARLDTLVDDVAEALCGALDRCCDGPSRAAFFAPLRSAERLAALRDRIPTDGPLDRARCAALLADAWRITPLGDWVRAAQAGRVTFRPDEADRCLTRLRAATCGGPVRAALTDSTCFAFAAPSGGAEQRRMFARTAVDGAACVGLADGVGGAFYGTCDPTRAFCCGMGGDGRCALVGTGVGTCRPVSAEGAACGVTPELRVCATGAVCVSARCEVEGTAPLAVGARCAMNFRLLGECVESYCDLGGSDRCEPLAADGAACALPTACRSGRCVMGRCAAETTCAGGG